MQLSKEAIKGRKMAVKKARFLEMSEEEKKKSPKVILEFAPDPNFEEELLEFIEEILSWERNPNEHGKAKNQQSKNARKNNVEK